MRGGLGVGSMNRKMVGGRRLCWLLLDLPHIAVVYGRDVTVVPGNRHTVPGPSGDDAPVRRVAPPVNAIAFLERSGLGGGHVFGQ